MTRLPNNGLQLTALRAARNRRPHALSVGLVAKALFRIRAAAELPSVRQKSEVS